jgi:hypothetical protein
MKNPAEQRDELRRRPSKSHGLIEIENGVFEVRIVLDLFAQGCIHLDVRNAVGTAFQRRRNPSPRAVFGKIVPDHVEINPDARE